MKNKVKIAIFLLIMALVVLISIYFFNIPKEINIQEINNCDSNTDCVIVAKNFCGGALAINKDYLDIWNEHLENERVKNLDVVCKPTAPLDFFEAKCVNSKCVAILMQGTKTGSPIQATLSLFDKPLLNMPVSLVLEFKSLLNLSNISAEIELPENFEFVSGNLGWQGDLNENETQRIEAIVKSTKIGYYQLKSIISNLQGPIGGSNILYVEVLQDDAIIGSRPENNWYESAQMQVIPLAQNNEQIQSELIISPKPGLNKEFTIIYRLAPSINIPDPQRTQMSLVFPPKAFKIIDVQFPDGGETYKHESSLSWKGSIAQGQTIEIKATFKVINTGWGFVYGGLNVQPSGEIINLIQDIKIVDLYVDKYVGNFS